MDVPIRQVETRVGHVLATAINGASVRVRTRSPNQGDPSTT
jgi:hypothetical protein